MEAAEAVVNELRLRDIGGIIVIDFIDMARARNRTEVLKTLRKSLEEDRTKTFTAEISKLGLVEMTRQNVTEGVREIMSRPCPTCDGEGVIKSEETIAIEFERRLREIAAEADGDVEAFLVRMNPRVIDAVHRRERAASCTSSRRTPASSSTSRAPRACRSTTSTSRWRDARGGRGEGDPVGRGRRGDGRDRRAAHVQRRRRRGEDRRLRHLASPAPARSWASSSSCA